MIVLGDFEDSDCSVLDDFLEHSSFDFADQCELFEFRQIAEFFRNHVFLVQWRILRFFRWMASANLIFLRVSSNFRDYWPYTELRAWVCLDLRHKTSWLKFQQKIQFFHQFSIFMASRGLRLSAMSLKMFPMNSTTSNSSPTKFILLDPIRHIFTHICTDTQNIQ